MALLWMLLLPFSSVAQTQTMTPSSESRLLIEQASKVANLFSDNPRERLRETLGEPEPDVPDADADSYRRLFSPGFLANVSSVQLTTIFTEYHQKYGVVDDVQLRRAENTTTGSFYFVFSEGFRIPVRTLSIESRPPHRITGLFFGPAEPVQRASSLDEITDRFAELPGHASFVVARTDSAGRSSVRLEEETQDDGALSMIASYQEKNSLAIGSAFKLYVLGALTADIEAGRRSWDDVIMLTEDARSFPSGFLHTWPGGSPLTLRTLATLMISQSDNTATDALIRELGRRAVEEMLEPMGHASPGQNTPFLTTREFFALKHDSTQADAYAAAAVEQKRQMLDGEIAQMSHEDISIQFASPNRIDTVEWFASGADLARALAWFTRDTDARTVAREILSVNEGVDFENDWTYVGFKGGSEPGVMSANVLLRSPNGPWYTLSVVQNNAEADIDPSSLFSLAKQAAQLVFEASTDRKD